MWDAAAAEAAEVRAAVGVEMDARFLGAKHVNEWKLGRVMLILDAGFNSDRGKISREAKLDGKFLVSTSDPHLSTEDIALGYKQLDEIERVNRDLKHTVDIRPVHHRRENRIRAHVRLCRLALSA